MIQAVQMPAAQGARRYQGNKPPAQMPGRQQKVRNVSQKHFNKLAKNDRVPPSMNKYSPATIRDHKKNAVFDPSFMTSDDHGSICSLCGRPDCGIGPRLIV